MKIKSVISILIFQFLLAWLLSINPEKEYGWFMGLIHGGLWLPNLIISLFKEGWYVQAPIHTTMYIVDWWIDAIFTGISWLGMFISLLAKK